MNMANCGLNQLRKVVCMLRGKRQGQIICPDNAFNLYIQRREDVLEFHLLSHPGIDIFRNICHQDMKDTVC